MCSVSGMWMIVMVELKHVPSLVGHLSSRLTSGLLSLLSWGGFICDLVLGWFVEWGSFFLLWNLSLNL
jgi:hypothetical protein